MKCFFLGGSIWILESAVRKSKNTKLPIKKHPKSVKNQAIQVWNLSQIHTGNWRLLKNRQNMWYCYSAQMSWFVWGRFDQSHGTYRTVGLPGAGCWCYLGITNGSGCCWWCVRGSAEMNDLRHLKIWKPPEEWGDSEFVNHDLEVSSTCLKWIFFWLKSYEMIWDLSCGKCAFWKHIIQHPCSRYVFLEAYIYPITSTPRHGAPFWLLWYPSKTCQ